MDITKTVRKYSAWTLGLTLLMYVGTLSIGMGAYGLIAAVFHILCSLAYIWGWQTIAHRSPETLPKYYLAGSAFRLIAAAMVLLVFCVIKRSDVETIKWFALVFIAFYLVILVFDAIFFAKISKTTNK